MFRDDTDKLDGRILGLIQARIPFLRRPYAQLASELGCSVDLLLERLTDLRSLGGPVREISGIFDVAALGYRRTLVALRVEAKDIDSAGQAAATHPGVSHCYGRQGRYNLWLTLAVSPFSHLGLTATASAIAKRAKAKSHLLLPALKRYKLQVQFPWRHCPDNTGHNDHIGHQTFKDTPIHGAQLTPQQTQAIGALQRDLPNRPEPFAPIAAAVGMDSDTLLTHADELLAGGYMRRYAAVLRHRQMGAKANVMVAWVSDQASADAAGAACGSLQAVSHCYLRGTGPDWPYSFYTMIHGQTRRQCRQTIDDLSSLAAFGDRAELWTVKEYKKRRVELFTDAEAKWETTVTKR